MQTRGNRKRECNFSLRPSPYSWRACDLRKWKADKHEVTCLCCHVDGKVLATAGRKIKLWNTEDHTLLQVRDKCWHTCKHITEHAISLWKLHTHTCMPYICAHMHTHCTHTHMYTQHDPSSLSFHLVDLHWTRHSCSPSWICHRVCCCFLR